MRRTDGGSRANRAAICFDLVGVDAAALERQRARRIDAGDGDFVVLVERCKVARHVTPETRQRCGEASHHIVERHVVVAGNHDLRRRQPVEECTRLDELAVRARAA